MVQTHSQVERRTPAVSPLVIALLLLVGVAAVAFVLRNAWLPPLMTWLAPGNSAVDQAPERGAHDAGHDDAPQDVNSLTLSAQARKNIGLTNEFIQPLQLQDFRKTISVPGMIVERPGRSVVEVTAPFTGVITRIHAIEGESLEPGKKLFDLRLTHEELVQTQAELLATSEELVVIRQEIARLETLAADGAIPGKRIIEQRYDEQKQEASLRAKRQALVLHGLSNAQIDRILQEKQLLREMTVTVPAINEDGTAASQDTVFQIQSIKVAQGQHVEAGSTLAILVDHELLYIEGEAFERDVAALNQAAQDKTALTAVVESTGAQREVIEDLHVLYLATRVDPQERTLDFYVTLPNQPQRDTRDAQGRRFFAWRFRPGQRVQLEIPVETWKGRIVLPIEAVAFEETETYVFVQNGDTLERRSVHVEYRDPRQAVIANDGSLFPGDRVALRAAQQLQIALKNKAGGAPDPHAGHSH
jgi:cobalt-zinc-cadmium efflux system membrane fusion protein